jgi:hypothetical protein
MIFALGERTDYNKVIYKIDLEPFIHLQAIYTQTKMVCK